MDPTSIKLLILDVDGVLTSGHLSLTAHGDEAKWFHVHDGCAIKLWRRCGGKVAILSGRASDSVNKRAAELGIEWVHTGVADKLAVYKQVLADAGMTDDVVAYVGDDLPDLGPMSRAALPVAVANAVPAVKRSAAYVARRPGGEGVVAEVVEWLLRKQNRWTRDLIVEA